MLGGFVYYIEIQHKENYGGDNVALYWKNINSGNNNWQLLPQNSLLGHFCSPSESNSPSSSINHIDELVLNIEEDPENEFQPNLQIYPNPAKDIVTIQIQGIQKNTL